MIRGEWGVGTCVLCEKEVLRRCGDGVCAACHREQPIDECVETVKAAARMDEDDRERVRRDEKLRLRMEALL
jgi:hypothetical protein